ncbi:MAG: AlkZ-related protein, partial [Anaerolineales bacterium]
AGDRPVANAHDDPGHVTWGWKDNLLGAKKWYYAKLLRGKATVVSLKSLPYFYALSENFGDYEHDYLSLFVEGRLTQAARQVFEALLAKGPLDTVALRKEARLTSKDSNTRFEKALLELQTGLKILPIGVAQAGAWRYAFRYEIVDRFYPDLAERAGALTRAQAREHLAALFIDSVGAATAKDVQRLFRWPAEDVRKTCQQLVEAGRVVLVERVGGETDEWLATPKLAR